MASDVWGQYLYCTSCGQIELPFGRWEFMLGNRLTSRQFRSVGRKTTPLGEVITVDGLPAFTASFEALRAEVERLPRSPPHPLAVAFPARVEGSPTYLPAQELSTAAQWCIHTIKSGREALSTCYGCPPLFSEDE